MEPTTEGIIGGKGFLNIKTVSPKNTKVMPKTAGLEESLTELE